MPSVTLTDASVKRLKAPPNERVEYFDQAFPGLALRVAGPTGRAKEGRRSWCLYYRNNGKLVRLTLGVYPEIGLQAARIKASEAKALKQQGTDPATAKAEQKAKAAAAAREPDAIDGVASEWIRLELEGRNRVPRYIREVRQMLDNHVLTRWSGKHVRGIQRRDVRALLDSVKENGSVVQQRDGTLKHLKGGPIAANRLRSVLRSLFAFCVDREMRDDNPVLSVRRPADEVKRDRVLSVDEVRAVLAAADATDYPYGPFFKLLLYSAARRSEVQRMKYADLNLDEALWTLPTTKAHRVHPIPLASEFVSLLQSLPRLSGRGGDGKLRSSEWVLTTTGAGPFRALDACKSRLDKTIAEQRGEPLAPWTIHDLRRSAASHMARLGISQFVIARCLNHANTGVTATYNRYEYLAEKRQALETWSAFLGSLMKPAADNLVKLARA